MLILPSFSWQICLRASWTFNEREKDERGATWYTTTRSPAIRTEGKQWRHCDSDIWILEPKLAKLENCKDRALFDYLWEAGLVYKWTGQVCLFNSLDWKTLWCVCCMSTSSTWDNILLEGRRRGWRNMSLAVKHTDSGFGPETPVDESPWEMYSIPI